MEDPEIKVGLLTCDKESAKSYNINTYIARDFRYKKNIVSKALSSIFLKYNFKITYNCLKAFMPDVIHIHDYIPFSPSMVKALYKYKKQYSCKIMLTHHTYSFICANDALYNYKSCQLCEKCIGKFNHAIIKDNCYNNYFGSILKYLQKKNIMKYLRNIVDLHIAPSYFMKEMLLKVNKNYNIDVVYNPCIQSINMNNVEKDNIIVYFGRISKEKNIVKIAKLFSEFNTTFRLLIIGTGESSKELINFLEDNKNSNIEFINTFLGSNTLYKTIENAKYLILPSVWYENSPVSIIEGINLGIIPLVSNIGGMKEIVDFFKIGYYFDPQDDNSILKVFKMLSNNKLYINKSEIMYKLDCFTIDKYKNNFKKSIEKMF